MLTSTSRSTNFFLCNSLLKPLTHCSGLKMSKLGTWNFRFPIEGEKNWLYFKIYEVDLRENSLMWPCLQCPKKRLASFLPFPRSLHILEIEWRGHHLNVTCRTKKRHPKGKCFAHSRACNNDDVSVVFQSLKQLLQLQVWPAKDMGTRDWKVEWVNKRMSDNEGSFFEVSSLETGSVLMVLEPCIQLAGQTSPLKIEM